MASWHKSQEQASRLCEANRAAKALLANQKTKERKERERRGRGGRGERERGGGKRRRWRVSSLFVVFVWVFLLFKEKIRAHLDLLSIPRSPFFFFFFFAALIYLHLGLLCP